MYSTCNESKSIVAEMFIRTLKAEIFNEMTGSDNKFYLGYLDTLVQENNNSYHRSTGKNHIDDYYSVLIEKIESIQKAPKLELVIKSRLLVTRIFLARVILKICQDKFL